MDRTQSDFAKAKALGRNKNQEAGTLERQEEGCDGGFVAAYNALRDHLRASCPRGNRPIGYPLYFSGSAPSPAYVDESHRKGCWHGAWPGSGAAFRLVGPVNQIFVQQWIIMEYCG